MKSVIALLVLSLFAKASQAASAPPLFSEILDAVQPTPPRALSAFPVTINFVGLDANPDSLELQLPGSELGTYTAYRVRFEQREEGGYHWIGKTSAHDVVITVNGDLITAFIRGGGGTYSVLSGVEGGSTSHALMAMDGDAFPLDVVEGEDQSFNSLASAKGTKPDFPHAQCFGAVDEPIDLLVVYSPEVLELAGGSLDVLENQMASAVAGANVTLFNSDIAARVRVVAIESAPLDLLEERNVEDLANARNNSELRDRRRAHKADATVYVTSDGFNGSTRYCGVTRTQRRAGQAFWGIGYGFYDSAVMVFTHQCGVQDNALSHEIGHMVGLDHNPPTHANGTPQTNPYPFSFGHHVNGQFRDDMSGANLTNCPDGCDKHMFFSDPAMFTEGFARGTASRNNAETYRRMYRCTNTLADFIFVDNFE